MVTWGKDPFGAVVMAVEFVGPCRFGGWVAQDQPKDGLWAGDPIAVPNPRAWVQAVAVSKEQPLALDTRVRTSRGWATVGDLKIGDFVYDEHGAPQKVRRQTEVFEGKKCYRLTFDDGQTVVATGQHGWTLERLNGHGDRFEQVTMTTEQVAEYVTTKRSKLRMPLPEVQGPEKDLPVDPYLLGLWLGDGASANGGITVGRSDLSATMEQMSKRLRSYETLTVRPAAGAFFVNIVRSKEICARGHRLADLEPAYTNGHPACRACRMQRQRKGETIDPRLPTMIERLRGISVLKNKHIPDDYLFASVEQRRELLRGLIDSDGMVDGSQAGFCNTNERIIDGMLELARSLGIKARKVARPRGGAWDVRFSCPQWPVACLPRKVGLQRERGVIASHRRIVEVTEIDSVPTKCIGIDTESHLFQVEGGIITHNTKNTMTIFQTLFTEDCAAEHQIDVGKEIIYAYGGQRRMEAVTSSPKAMEGNRPSFVLANETHHWMLANQGVEMGKVIRRNLAKSKGGQARMLAITNAYEEGAGSVAEKRRETYEAAITKGRTPEDIGVLYDSVEASPDAYLALPAKGKGEDGLDEYPSPEEIKAYIGAIIDAVRGDASWLDVDRLVGEILDGETTTEEARRFYYNQIGAEEDAWLLPVAISRAIDKACREAAELIGGGRDDARWLTPPDEPIVMFFDGSKSLDATALVGCRLSDGHVFTIGVWQRPPGKRGSRWTAPRSAVDERVRAAFERFDVVGFWADPSHAKDDEDGSAYWDALIDSWHLDFKDRLRPELWAVKSAERTHSIMWDMTSPTRSDLFAQAARRFVEELETKNDIEEIEPTFTIDGHPLLVAHLSNARRRVTKWGESLGKAGHNSSKKIDAAVCAVGARMLRRVALNVQPEEEETPARFWSY